MAAGGQAGLHVNSPPAPRPTWIQEIENGYEGPTLPAEIRRVRRLRGQHAPEPSAVPARKAVRNQRLREGEGKWQFGRGRDGRFIRQPTLPDVSDRSHIFADSALPADALSSAQERALDLVFYEEWRILVHADPDRAQRAIERWPVGSSSMKDSRGNRVIQFSELVIGDDEDAVDAVDRATGGNDYGLGSGAHLDRLDGADSAEDWLNRQPVVVLDFVERLAEGRQTVVAGYYGVHTRTVRRWTAALRKAVELRGTFIVPPKMRRTYAFSPQEMSAFLASTG